MAALLPFLKNQGAFDPETVQAMSAAFDDVCKALRLKLSETKGREAVAKKIIEMARQGELNPALLSTPEQNASARRSKNTSMMLARRPPNWGPFRQASGLGGMIRRRVRTGTA
jgi:hypothetical protein